MGLLLVSMVVMRVRVVVVRIMMRSRILRQSWISRRLVVATRVVLNEVVRCSSLEDLRYQLFARRVIQLGRLGAEFLHQRLVGVVR